MTKLEWLKAEFQRVSGGRQDFWPDGQSKLIRFVEEAGESLSRGEFWRVFQEQFHASIASNGPTPDALSAWDHFTEDADFSLVWDVAPAAIIPGVPSSLLSDLIRERDGLIKLGGEPEWVQGPAYPICPSCQRDMTFILQFRTAVDRDFARIMKSELWSIPGSPTLYIFGCIPCGSFELVPQYD